MLYMHALIRDAMVRDLKGVPAGGFFAVHPAGMPGPCLSCHGLRGGS